VHGDLIARLIETFKILKQHLHIDPTKFLTLSPTNFTRGHDCKLYKSRSKLLLDPRFLLTTLSINGMLYSIK